MKDMSETDKAWLAGLLDGDGSFFVQDMSSHPTHSRYNPRLNISILMCHEATIRHCQQLTGIGHVHMTQLTTAGTQAWKWRVGVWEDVEKLCKAVLPYLITKREQAETLLDIANMRVESWTECSAVARDREQTYTYLKDLNFSKQ